MRDKLKGMLIMVGVVAALGVGGAVVAGAAGGGGGNEGPDKAISGSALSKAKAAALAHTGGGRVTDTERGDEESLYEVEVTKDDGSQVDVQLDEGFNVVGTKADQGDHEEGVQDDQDAPGQQDEPGDDDGSEAEEGPEGADDGAEGAAAGGGGTN
jgi:hypothetical protein